MNLELSSENLLIAGEERSPGEHCDLALRAPVGVCVYLMVMAINVFQAYYVFILCNCHGPRGADRKASPRCLKPKENVVYFLT